VQAAQGGAEARRPVRRRLLGGDGRRGGVLLPQGHAAAGAGRPHRQGRRHPRRLVPVHGRRRPGGAARGAEGVAAREGAGATVSGASGGRGAASGAPPAPPTRPDCPAPPLPPNAPPPPPPPPPL